MPMRTRYVCEQTRIVSEKGRCAREDQICVSRAKCLRTQPGVILKVAVTVALCSPAPLPAQNMGVP